MTVLAILTAAGSGSRLGADLPKALVEVGGHSLLYHATTGLLDSGVVDGVVVTAPGEYLAQFRAEVADFGQRVSVVAGSPASRQASVALGLEAALARDPEVDVVLVHDAARALTPPAVVQRVVAAVQAGATAVIPVVPVTDTIKTAASGANGEQVAGTVPRETLRAVQTPQGFATQTLVRAHRLGAARSGDETLAASDDAGLVEAAGGTVAMVAGDERAFKVTRPLDLAWAQTLLDHPELLG